jgi:hypothetical protein
MTAPLQEILCRTTPWYAKRRIIMVVMLVGFSSYFFYDWKVGYPKQKAEYDAYWPVYQELAITNKDDKAWLARAKDNGWPESPKEKDWDYKLKEQFIWGACTGLIGLGMLIAYLRNKDRVLRADADSLTMPDGVRIPFSSVTRIDKRKWDNKALAYLSWKDGATPRKAVIDDLVFDGAGKVLDRLMSHFHGELIDIEREPSAPGSNASGENSVPASGQEP